MEEKNTLSHEVVCFQMLDFDTSKSKSEVLKSKFVGNYFFLEKYVTSEEALRMFHTIDRSPLLVTK